MTTLAPLRLMELSLQLHLQDNFPNLDWDTFPKLEHLKKLDLSSNNLPQDILYTLSSRVPKLTTLSLRDIPFIHSFREWETF